MADWHIGQQVVCISGAREVKRGETLPVKGRIYTIRDFYDHVKVGLCLYLEEIVNEPRKYIEGFMEMNFSVRGFRPVRKTDISVFTAMLNPTKIEEKV